MTEQRKGRPPRYLTIEKFEEFKDKLFNNHLYHLRIELRVNSVINLFLFGMLITLLILIVNG